LKVFRQCRRFGEDGGVVPVCRARIDAASPFSTAVSALPPAVVMTMPGGDVRPTHSPGSIEISPDGDRAMRHCRVLVPIFVTLMAACPDDRAHGRRYLTGSQPLDPR
jgi:hypothetical protein